MSLEVMVRHRVAGFQLQADFTAPAGLTVLFGPSGSGKSTLIDAVSGLIRPDHARIVADDRVLSDTEAGIFVPPHRRRLGHVFQTGRLFPHLSVRRNLTYGMRPGPADFDRVVRMLGIDHLLQRSPAGLSGGERSRVAIGRALLAQPRLILADEPLAALDEARKAEILPYFERLRDEALVPILYVSHSVPEVTRLATTVVALRAGRVIAQGSPAQVLGDGAMGDDAASIIGARVVRHHDDGLSELAAPSGPLWVPRTDAAPGQALRLRVGARDIVLSQGRPEGLSALNILPGRIAALRDAPDGSVMVTLQMGPDRLIARITRRSASAMRLAEGQDCHAILKSVAVQPSDIAPDRA
ncbi:molybdenum ABC transporter ATP-binding protein [Paracoccus sp. 1_MG-2023]|uniref:molybdenum ABC transporter ATP-binding protein n=1 Tax=unclassified Paracoccus (in: a-proteobacteria) TaxID=2688777 RepID=UPI001C091A15|nr:MULTISPECIES: molybdenum ABC transporter ATP-binding protein [unclassified Paracoccus (in: a-proteobacteria)]MBU2956267.1 molybdenum ABC transporter ATP-binding protein [Paracoccus sp. C2R09]MDO6667943.1 molybdenum ABC transporter ATP-binding protein [Paracoccus sp. 1_MG-2023]